MLKDFDTNKLDELIKDKFPIIYEYNFDGIVLLYGGAIRDTIMGKNNIHDLDFIILSQGDDKIKEFISKYNLCYRINAYGGYKITYNNLTIDIFSTDDLLTVTYDIDTLFYDIDMKLFIPIGVLNACRKRVITEISNDKDPLFNYKMRRKKLIKFVKYITKSDKRVKVKENIPYIIYRKKRRKLRKHINSFKNGNFRKCLRFLNGCEKEFKTIIMLGILISIILAIIPTLTGNLVEKILYTNMEKAIYIIMLMVLLRLTKIILQYFFSKLYAKIKKTMVFNIRKEVFSNVLDFEMINFNTNSSGSFTNKIKDDSNEIAMCFNKIKDIMVRGIGNFGIVIYICYLNPIIGIILIISLYIIYNIKMVGIMKKISAKKKVLYEQEKYSSMINEMLTGINDIKTLDLKENYKQITIDKFREVSEIEYDGDNAENIYNKLANLLEFASFGIIIIVGMYLINKKLLSPSSLVIIYMYKSSAFGFLDKIVLLMNTRLNFNLACFRIFSLLDENKYKKEKYGNNKFDRSNGIIEFKNVSFGYNNKYVLEKCSFKTNKYDTVAIVGESGAGKTTIINLISKMYIPQKGNILIDGYDINEFSYEYIKGTISVVSQTPYLFDMSIKDNLRLVKEDITDEEIKDVCKKVCLDTFIESLPNKYDTVIGEGGTTLSQGQKQRLGIARAIIKNTPIILLDEITSALDKDTGSNIKKLINNIKKNHTIIMVTHDLSMIDGFKVLTLKNGKIVNEN